MTFDAGDLRDTKKDAFLVRNLFVGVRCGIFLGPLRPLQSSQSPVTKECRLQSDPGKPYRIVLTSSFIST